MDNSAPENTLAPPFNYARLGRVIKFESLSIVVLLFALFFTNGYVYLQVINTRLGVPMTRLGFDTYAYAVYGGVNMLLVFIAIFIALAIVAFFSTLAYFLENPDRIPHSPSQDPESWRYRLAQWLGKRSKRAKEPMIATLLICALAAIFGMLWKLTVSSSIERAELHAYNEVRNCEPAIIQLNNLDSISGCIVGESEDMLYLVKKNSETNGEIQLEKTMVPKHRIRSTTAITTLKRPS